MNKVIAAGIACAFALGSTAVLGQDQTKAAQRQQELKAQEGQATNLPPTTPEEQKALNAASARAKAAKAEFDKMSPEEQAAYKKGMAAQHQMDLQAQGVLATPIPPTTPEQQKALNALKKQPKELQNPAQHQEATKDAEKQVLKPGGGG